MDVISHQSLSSVGTIRAARSARSGKDSIAITGEHENFRNNGAAWCRNCVEMSPKGMCDRRCKGSLRLVLALFLDIMTAFVNCSKDRSDVPRRYPPDRSHRGAELHAGTLVRRKTPVFLVLHHRDHEYG